MFGRVVMAVEAVICEPVSPAWNSLQTGKKQRKTREMAQLALAQAPEVKGLGSKFPAHPNRPENHRISENTG
jgi:hypothetical protein